MTYKTRLTSLSKIGSRIFIAAACAMLFMPSAGAVVVSASGDTIHIDFLLAGDTGYWNDFPVDSDIDWDELDLVPHPFDFDLTITGEYYIPTSPPSSDNENYIPETWTQVYDPLPDENLVGVYDGLEGMGLSSSTADEFNDVDGCQDVFCTGTLRWEALTFSFDRPVTLTVIGFKYIDSTSDFNLTVINSTTTTYPYIDEAPVVNGLYPLSASQTGTVFRIWTDFEDDWFRITGIKIQAANYPGDLAPRGAPDGRLNVADVLILSRLLSGQITATAAELLLGDINGNAGLDAGDLLLLQRTVLGHIPPSPALPSPAF